MKLHRSSAAYDLRLVVAFDNLRQQLLSHVDRNRLGKPLAFWALPTDRRLPLAFLDRAVSELLATPFESLFATPGIGRRKITSLLTLLERVADHDEAATVATGAEDNTAEPHGALPRFDANYVCEETWVYYRQAVMIHGLEAEPLGRFAPTLERLPRVLWDTPLADYTGHTLAEIRQRKTHGEKRVAAVLEVFDAVYHAVGRADRDPLLAVRPLPRIAQLSDTWVTEVLQRKELPTREETLTRFVEPWLQQLRIDAGDFLVELLCQRLELSGTTGSVRQTARRLGLTRARIYQLFDDAALIAHVRWPDAAMRGALLRSRLQEVPLGEQSTVRLLHLAIDSLCPARSLQRRGDVGMQVATHHGETSLALAGC